ncbi:MAG: hypothetical protein WKG00_05100 [Polyangiaceae bacterium]
MRFRRRGAHASWPQAAPFAALLARVDVDAADRALMVVPGVTPIVGLHRQDATTVLVVGDDRVERTYPGVTTAQCLRQ